MAIFKRRKNQTVAELEEYYASKKPRTGGMAWVMAIVSLLITILVVSALFFGGRWIYRSLTNDTTDVTVTTTETNDDNVNDFGESEGKAETDENFPGVVTDQAASTSTPSSSSPSSSSSTSPANTDLPSTGPGEVSFIIMAITFVAGYYLMLKKQKANR